MAQMVPDVLVGVLEKIGVQQIFGLIGQKLCDREDQGSRDRGHRTIDHHVNSHR